MLTDRLYFTQDYFTANQYRLSYANSIQMLSFRIEEWSNMVVSGIVARILVNAWHGAYQFHAFPSSMCMCDVIGLTTCIFPKVIIINNDA